jgi:hypothetical protein
MNLNNRMDERGTNSLFRISLSIVMGVIYIGMGALVFSMRSFGTIELPATTAMVLAGVLAAYGAFRIYRGIVDMRIRKSQGE